LKNYVPQLLHVYEVSDVRQMKIYSAEPLAPEPSSSDVEIIVAKLRKYKWPSTDQIPTEFIKGEVETL
jgi:hypothetical protein